MGFHEWFGTNFTTLLPVASLRHGLEVAHGEEDPVGGREVVLGGDAHVATLKNSPRGSPWRRSGRCCRPSHASGWRRRWPCCPRRRGSPRGPSAASDDDEAMPITMNMKERHAVRTDRSSSIAEGKIELPATMLCYHLCKEWCSVHAERSTRGVIDSRLSQEVEARGCVPPGKPANQRDYFL